MSYVHVSDYFLYTSDFHKSVPVVQPTPLFCMDLGVHMFNKILSFFDATICLFNLGISHQEANCKF